MCSTSTPPLTPCGARSPEPTGSLAGGARDCARPAAAVGAQTRLRPSPATSTRSWRSPRSTTGRELEWRCVSGHEPWQDSTFRFQLAALDDGRARLRFWQDYAVELADDYYGVYNFNWGYYLESLRLLCVTGTGKPFQAVP